MREAIFLLALASTNSGIALRVIEPMLPQLAADFGASVSETAIVIIAYAIAQLIHGPLGDRFGKLRVVTLTLFCAGAGCYGCALAQGLASLSAMRFVTGAFASTPVILGMAYIGDRVAVAERQPVIARFVMGTISGQALGPFIGGAVTDLVGWRGTFALIGTIFMVVATVLLVRTRSQWAGDLGKKFEGNPFATHLRLAHEPRVRRVLAVGAIETFFFFGAFSFLGAYFKLKFGMSLTLAGAILAGFGVGGVLYGLMVRRLLMELGQRGLVLWGAIWCCVFFAATALTPVWPVLFVCTIGLGYSFYMLHNTLQVKATEMSSTARGTAVAMYSSAWAIGQAVGAAGMGLSIGWLDYAPSIVAFGAGYLLLGVWLRRNLEKL
ncbi:MAG TPA: MFS transporter [Burkholderiales bacterium]